MSYLAVGSVTQSIATLLASKLNKPPLMGTGTTFRVTALPPDDDRVNDQTGVNLFLYRIHEDPFTKNMGWRGDKTNPVRNGPPPLSLNLSYLLTPYVQKTGGTAQDDITAHQVLGNAMAILHDYPVLNDIHDSDFDANLDTQFPAELRNAFDKIKITMMPGTLEELSKIWTGLIKAYRLSVAYEVSLVEIGPTKPIPLPAAGAQTFAVGVNTLAAPQIISVQPQSGPAGSTVTIRGANLQRPGNQTSVQAGADIFSENELLSVSPTEIQFVIPAAPQGGPQLPVIVSAGGSQSQPSVYNVTPWISRVTPLRGITGIPVTIPIALPAAATVQVNIGGMAATTTVDPQNQFVTAVVPTTIAANGPQPLTLTLNGQNSNALVFEVLPAIGSVTVTTSAAPVSTTITIVGERLSGQDVSALVGGLLIQGGANADATQLVLTVERSLAATTPVTVTVDGSISNTIPPRLDGISPASAFAGDPVMLTGDSLSGRNVSVNFDAVSVNLGPQPFISRMQVNIPETQAPGLAQVTVTVDGQVTNPASLKVLG
jgi:hypothetical protein